MYEVHLSQKTSVGRDMLGGYFIRKRDVESIVNDKTEKKIGLGLSSEQTN